MHTTKGPAGLTIRALASDDRVSWGALWHAYLAFYDRVLPPATYDHHFARLTTPFGDFRALVAERDGQLVGLAHFVFHPHGWKPEGICYLQDLFAAPSVRGTGIGAALINAVYAAADTRGVPSVYWHTQDDNTVARRLYDQIGTATPFVVYRRPE
jgi:GNAT superfamily N-acetyltransferase